MSMKKVPLYLFLKASLLCTNDTVAVEICQPIIDKGRYAAISGCEVLKQDEPGRLYRGLVVAKLILLTCLMYLKSLHAVNTGSPPPVTINHIRVRDSSGKSSRYASPR